MSNQNAYWDAPSSRWDIGLRWAKAGPGPKTNKPMAIIAINVSTLTLPQRLVKGQQIITMSTGNTNVPGNTALVTALTAAQAVLNTGNNAYEEARQTLKGLLATRDAGLVNWNIAVTNLAAFTESATAGDADKILTTGFDVRSAGTPPQPVTQVENVKVTYTGMPGYSAVQWKRETNADAYVVERSPEPITATGWDNVGTVTEAKYTGNGATPGQKYWYRVAAVNKLGQGPWSEPALRPVM